MTTMKAKWRKLAASESLQRSSHILGGIGDKVVIFGGELKPRQPVDGKVYTLPIGSPNSSDNVEILDSSCKGETPVPRVGSASATIGDTLYLFSGRGGPSMKPLDEAGSIWSLSLSGTQDPKWRLIKPTRSLLVCAPTSGEESSGVASPGSWPDPRSYHTMTSDNCHTLYLHAGCPVTGRLSDLWAFQLEQGRWIRLADAPSPARGGASIVFTKKERDAYGKLYRTNGFDGTSELGGSVDIYDIAMDSWSSIRFEADAVQGPIPRSVGCLVALNVNGQECLVTFGGERNLNDQGHEGAGKMLGDVWIWSLRSETWAEVEVDGDNPSPRGWFAAAAVRSGNKNDALVIHGGLDEENTRLGDVWLLEF